MELALGYLIYNTDRLRIDFEDRTLAHLRPVISTKLRRHEPFFFCWSTDASVGGGRGAIWLSSAIPLFFHFESSERQAINRAWIEQLARAADSTTGLVLMPEPDVQPVD